MSNAIDARGLSCPQPVILTLNAIKKSKEKQITIIVDTETAKENVSRASIANGWSIADIQVSGDDCTITIRRMD